MFDRRTLLQTAAITPLVGASGMADASAPGGVDPFVGTGGHGHCFPGATLPFGLVQLSPDTDTARWDACGGYHYGDTTIMGFSHTHLSGVGAQDMLDLLIVPGTGAVELQPGTPNRPGSGYRQRFDHADEAARPGYYRVRLANGVACELTVTARAGLSRFTFPAGAGHLLIDWAHSQQDSVDWPHADENTPKKPLPVRDATMTLSADGVLTGRRTVDQWAGGRRVYFALRVSRPFDRAQLYAEDAAIGGHAAAGKYLKAALHWDAAGAEPVLVTVGISHVDTDGALANLAEIPRPEFARVAASAERAWSRELDRVRVEGGTADERRIFETALYHALLGPTRVSDADGRYPGMDGRVQRAAPGADAYTAYSFWDVYRAQMPLLSLAWPDRARALHRDIIVQGAQSPAGPLIWPLIGKETGTMIGWHSSAVLAAGHTNALGDIDYAAAWPVFRQAAFGRVDERMGQYAGVGQYRRLGYCPADEVPESVSRTLEYAYDDWAVAAIADAAGAREDAAKLRARSRNWRNLYDRASGFMRPRLADGRWVTPFDPDSIDHWAKWRDYTEANAWQTTFLQQHDVYAFAAMLGSAKVLETRLDGLFAAPFRVTGHDVPPDIAGNIGQYVHGNEPCHHVIYLYAYAGAQWKTAARARQVMARLYHAAPDGMAGNDDCGQMSAWYVLSALGLYPVDPVSGVWVFGSPLFSHAEVRVDGGTLSIEAPGNGADTPYIQSVTWNGRPHAQAWIGQRQLARGGRLVFRMGPRPNPRFGAAATDRPPSFVVGATTAPA